MTDDEHDSPLLLVKVKADLDYSIKKRFFDGKMPFRFFALSHFLSEKTYVKKLYLDRLESYMYDDTP